MDDVTAAARPAEPTIGAGRPSPRFESWIDPDASVAYALATNDTNEVFLRGAAVPPVYTATLLHTSLGGGSRAVELGAIRNSRGAVHAEHDITFHRTIRPGDVIRWTTAVYAVRRTRAGVLVSQHVAVTGADDEPLADHLWSSLYLGGEVDTELGPDLPDHAFPEAARARHLATGRVDITPDQPFRYAGASGDRNAHCVDDRAAQAEGFPRKILQGVCTFAMCSGVIVRDLAGGDPDRLRRLACRFTSPVHPGQPLSIELYDGGRTAEGLRLVAFEAFAGETAVLRHGRAELAG